MQTILRVLVLALIALQTDPGRDALRIGRTTDQTVYDAFSAGYQLAASGPVARAEVITEFRRAVLLVRERAEQGEYGFTERDLDRALAPYRGLVTVVAEIRLNPLNTYVTPPAFNLYIRANTDLRRRVRRPRFAAERRAARGHVLGGRRQQRRRTRRRGRQRSRRHHLGRASGSLPIPLTHRPRVLQSRTWIDDCSPRPHARCSCWR